LVRTTALLRDCLRQQIQDSLHERKVRRSKLQGRREDLIGKNLLPCHPPEAQEKLKNVMASGRPNVYTTEKRGTKKMVYHCHWKRDGRTGGLVEFSFELPSKVPNFVRT